MHLNRSPSRQSAQHCTVALTQRGVNHAACTTTPAVSVAVRHSEASLGRRWQPPRKRKTGTIMTESMGTDSSVPHHSRLANELAGSWHVLTGHAEMLSGATFADP